jgi:hypothetical protein
LATVKICYPLKVVNDSQSIKVYTVHVESYFV